MMTLTNILGFLTALLMVTSSSVHAQYLDNASEAFQLAQQRNRPVMLIFSGSDWCAACMRFERNIMNDSLFQSYADSDLILLRADFPQRTVQPDQIVSQNESLAERYNTDGKFPTLVLLRADGKIITYLVYHNQPPDLFIRELAVSLKQRSSK